MATPRVTRSTEESWDLSIEELLRPMTEMPRLGGPGPFVINLSTATAPIEVSPQMAAAFVPETLYMIQRSEDRRMRFRLRLGPFATEDAADAMLIKVREIYPCALTATAADDDLRAIAAHQPRASAARAAAAASAAAAAVTPRAAPAPNPPTAPPATPRAAAPAAPASATRVPAAPVRPPVALPPRAAMAPVSAPAAPAPSLESTQTVRALTPRELDAEQAPRWFAIQLSVAERPFDPDELPSLDIFNVYRLYSVAGHDQGRVRHALRLGFFSEEIAARAVASYLAGYYDHATVQRVSVAERERFGERRVEARKDVGATGNHAVIEITGERTVRPKRNPSIDTGVQTR
jgi:hypothetical protein